MYSDELYDLRVEIDTENYEVPDLEREKMEADFDNLRRLVSEFPVSELHVRIDRNPRSEQFHVKTSLRMPKRTLFTGEKNNDMYPAFNRCMRKLLRKVKGFKEKLDHKPEKEKSVEGTAHEVRPELEPEAAKLEEAIVNQDYTLFREALQAYDEPLEKRVGRWIERYPALAGRLGDDFTISDIREEVYLNAFESYASRPSGRLGSWLESLIDPSLRALADDLDQVKEEVDYAKETREEE